MKYDIVCLKDKEIDEISYGEIYMPMTLKQAEAIINEGLDYCKEGNISIEENSAEDGLTLVRESLKYLAVLSRMNNTEGRRIFREAIETLMNYFLAKRAEEQAQAATQASNTQPMTLKQAEDKVNEVLRYLNKEKEISIDNSSQEGIELLIEARKCFLNPSRINNREYHDTLHEAVEILINYFLVKRAEEEINKYLKSLGKIEEISIENPAKQELDLLITLKKYASDLKKRGDREDHDNYKKAFKTLTKYFSEKQKQEKQQTAPQAEKHSPDHKRHKSDSPIPAPRTASPSSGAPAARPRARRAKPPTTPTPPAPSHGPAGAGGGVSRVEAARVAAGVSHAGAASGGGAAPGFGNASRSTSPYGAGARPQAEAGITLLDGEFVTWSRIREAFKLVNEVIPMVPKLQNMGIGHIDMQTDWETGIQCEKSTSFYLCRNESVGSIAHINATTLILKYFRYIENQEKTMQQQSKNASTVQKTAHLLTAKA